MNKRIYNLMLALTIVLASVAVGFGQSTKTTAAVTTPATRTNSSAAATDALTMLPASDVVMYVDVQRLLTESVPRILAASPAKLAEYTAHLDKLKTQAGVDPRQFDRIAVGVRNSNINNPQPQDVAVIAHGTFNADALLAAGRMASNGKYNKTDYKGKTIYNFTQLETQKRRDGTSAVKATEFYVTVLDPSTLAMSVGSPARLQATIDANSTGGARVDAALAQLATRTPGAVIGFGGNVPANASQGMKTGNDEMDRAIASIRQIYGSINTPESGIDLLIAPITGTAEQAKTLSDTISIVKQFSGMVVAQAPANFRPAVQSILDTLQITPQNNEVQVKLSVPSSALSTFMTSTPKAKPSGNSQNFKPSVNQ